MINYYINKLGFCLVPLTQKQKKPFHKNWVTRKFSLLEIVNHLEQGGNIGVNLGLSSLLVLDVDNLELAKEFLKEELRLDYKDLVNSTLSIDATNAKPVFRFYAEEHHHLPPKLYTKITHKGKSVLEIRAGMGRQEVIPPSVHPSGFVYKWASPGNKNEIRTIAPVPREIFNFLNQSSGADKSQKNKNVIDSPYEGLDCNRSLVEEFLKYPRSALKDLGYELPLEYKAAPLLTSSGFNIIEIFNDMYSVQEVLTLAGYIKVNEDLFLYPKSESNTPGVRVLNNKYCYSHHAGDPLHAKTLSAFGVFATLFFNEDYAAAVRYYSRRGIINK